MAQIARQGRGGGLPPEVVGSGPSRPQSVPSRPGILGLSMGSKSPTRGHMTHYVTSEQQGPVIPPLFLTVWSWKPPECRCVLQLEDSRVTALFLPFGL